MVIFYSGSCGIVKKAGLIGEPENVLGKKTTFMLSYYLIKHKNQDQHRRLAAIVNQGEYYEESCKRNGS